MRAALCSIACLVALGCAHAISPEPRVLALLTSPRDPARVRLLSLNAHRLFDLRCDSRTCGGSAYEALPSDAAFDAQVHELAFGIARATPDAVCLQEVESESALDALQRALGGRFPTAVLGETGGPGSVDVAVLARDPLREVRRHRRAHPLVLPDGRRAQFAREFLEVSLDHHGREVVVFCAHFRSKVNDEPERRAAEGAEAATIVTAVAQARPDALVLMAGDLNDHPGSDALNALQRSGLRRVAERLGPEGDITWRGRAGAFALDHILHAPTAARWTEVGVEVLRDDERGYSGSDHAALRADFALAP
ncbi:MAG: endonuclease/exonuclease/phosphatase family protein [Polyangiales bacterium]